MLKIYLPLDFGERYEKYRGMLLEILKEKEPKEKLSLLKIEYNPISGIGYVNGKRFKFKDDQPEYQLFRELYKRIGNKIPREKVLKLINFKSDEPVFKEPEWTEFRKQNDVTTSETLAINKVVKKIRSRTGLTPDQLVNNNGNLTLVAQKVIKSS